MNNMESEKINSIGPSPVHNSNSPIHSKPQFLSGEVKIKPIAPSTLPVIPETEQEKYYQTCSMLPLTPEDSPTCNVDDELGSLDNSMKQQATDDFLQKPIGLSSFKRKFKEGTKGGIKKTKCDMFWERFHQQNILTECSSDYHTMKCHIMSMRTQDFLSGFSKKQPDEQFKPDELPSNNEEQSTLAKLGRPEAIKSKFDDNPETSNFSDFERVEVNMSELSSPVQKKVKLQEYPSVRYMILYVLEKYPNGLSKSLLFEKICENFDIQKSCSLKKSVSYYIRQMVNDCLLLTSNLTIPGVTQYLRGV